MATPRSRSKTTTNFPAGTTPAGTTPTSSRQRRSMGTAADRGLGIADPALGANFDFVQDMAGYGIAFGEGVNRDAVNHYIRQKVATLTGGLPR